MNKPSIAEQIAAVRRTTAIPRDGKGWEDDREKLFAVIRSLEAHERAMAAFRKLVRPEDIVAHPEDFTPQWLEAARLLFALPPPADAPLVEATTPPLALCIAALRARQASPQPERVSDRTAQNTDPSPTTKVGAPETERGE